MPATYIESEEEAETLEITLCDKLTGLEVVLSYTAFELFDAITKSVRIKNKGTQKINIKSVLSSTTYLFDKEYELVHLEGTWIRERSIQKRLLMNCTTLTGSKQISGGYFHSPFIALTRS